MESLDLVWLAVGAAAGLLLALRPTAALWVLFVAGMALCGPIAYFVPDLASIRWSLAPISLCLCLRAGSMALFGCSGQRPGSSRVVAALLVLALCVLVTTLKNRHFAEALASAKNFFQLWGVPLALAFLVKEERTVRRLMGALLVLAFLQPPLAVIQSLFFTGATYPGDSITGTFGGQAAHGGPNAAMSMFLIVQMAVLLLLAANRQWRWSTALTGVVWLSVPILLANAKVVLLLFPLMLVIFRVRELVRRPMLAVTILGAVTLLTAGTFVYYFLHASQYGRAPTDESDYVGQTVAYNVSDSTTHGLTRLGVLGFWAEEHASARQLPFALLGHGLGSVKDDGLVFGHVAARMGYENLHPGRTALASLLWEIGVVGTLAFMAVFAVALLQLRRRQSRGNLPPFHRVQVAAAQLACLFFLISLPYKNSLLSTQSFHLFSMLVLGYAIFIEQNPDLGDTDGGVAAPCAAT